MTTILSATTNGNPSSSPGMSLKFIPPVSVCHLLKSADQIFGLYFLYDLFYNKFRTAGMIKMLNICKSSGSVQIMKTAAWIFGLRDLRLFE